MSGKNFMNISKNECLVVYKNILQHSDRKWETGKKLALTGDYGEATSMAIISIEEMVKAMVLLLDGQGFEFRSRTEGIKTVFENHQIRYLLAYAMFVISIFGDDFIAFFEPYKANPSEVTPVLQNMINDKEGTGRKMKWYFLKKMILFKREFAWFSKIDLFRQDGFYCDYDGELKSPININEEDYKGVYLRLEKVKKVGKGLIEGFELSGPELEEMLKKIKDDFIAMNYYTHIGDALSKIRQSRKNPFEHLAEQFGEPLPKYATTIKLPV